MEKGNSGSQLNADFDPSIQLAMAMAIVQSTCHPMLPLLPPPPPPPSPSPSPPLPPPSASPTNNDATNNFESDASKWKRKAKQRKEEILRLKEYLKIAEDGMNHDVFPQNVSCKCYFFDSLGQLSPRHRPEQQRHNDVLRRRFLRQVRLGERKRRKPGGSFGEWSNFDSVNEMEQLRASTDFLVELCDTLSLVGVEQGYYKNWSHQAVDFILATLKALSCTGKMDEKIESIVSGLIVRLVRRMCNGSEGDDTTKNDIQFYVQHLMRKLGEDPYVGQRAILAVSERISMVSESLLFMDPFDFAFPRMHNCMYVMIQLVEFLISDHFLSWSTCEGFDLKLLEEWLLSISRARKALELLESRNSLYMLYMDRVVGELTRKLGQVPFLEKLQPDILAKLFGSG